MKSASRHITLNIQISAEWVPAMLSACQLRAMLSACPDSVRVPMIRSVAVEAMSEAPMTKFRKVCTAMTSFAGLRMTLATQRVRASSLTRWIV